MWEEILDRLEDSKDLQNFCRAFPDFETILHQTKQSWLIDLVKNKDLSYKSFLKN